MQHRMKLPGGHDHTFCHIQRSADALQNPGAGLPIKGNLVGYGPRFINFEKDRRFFAGASDCAPSCGVVRIRSSHYTGVVPAFLAMRSQSFSVCTKRFLASVWPLLKHSVKSLRHAKSGGGADSALSRSITSITT